MNRSKRNFLLVLAILYVFVTTCCPLSIGASIFIPAFLRAVKKSKHAEAEGTFHQAQTHIQNHWAEHCQMPLSVITTSRVPAHGDTIAPSQRVKQAWAKTLGVHFEEELYFNYQGTRIIDGDAQSYKLVAKADFIAGDAIHTYTQHFIGDTQTCTLSLEPPTLSNEFE